ncbi:MAG: Fungal specific transcription factor [Bathelium mastoideum]|nr:MAG: Fungal specific transcription factor [Bathelium mastoideum]
MKPVLPRLAPVPATPTYNGGLQVMLAEEGNPAVLSMKAKSFVFCVSFINKTVPSYKVRFLVSENCQVIISRAVLGKENRQLTEISRITPQSSPQEIFDPVVKQEEVLPPPPPPPPSLPPAPPASSSVLGQTLGLQPKQHCRYVGPTAAYDQSLLGLSQFDGHNESQVDFGTVRKVDEHECFIMYSDETTTTSHNEVEALNLIEEIVAPHGPSLIDVYFRIVHPSFPIIQKQVFLDRYRNNDRQFNSALLAGMYMLALNWWPFEERLAGRPKPDSVRLEQIAYRSLEGAMRMPKLSTMQAGLLLLQKPDADLWSLTTQLVAVGQELGLHLDCSRWQIPVWEKGLRKRIAWALYMQDKWSSLIHGRPSHIFDANWAVKPLASEDFVEDAIVSAPAAPPTEEERASAEQGQEVFSQMIFLTSIMAEVMDTFYTQSAISDFNDAGSGATQLILERAKPVQIKLKEWFAQLPASTRMDSNIGGNQLSSTGYLHLGYFATEITLHRRIVQSLDSHTSDPYLLYICRSAAKTRLISAMDFVNRLRPAHLQAFWYFASRVNFTLVGTFGSLLWASAPTREEADFYRVRLREYRWTLSVSSRRARFLEYAVQMLDASRALLRNLAEKPTLVPLRTSAAGVPEREELAGEGGVEGGLMGGGGGEEGGEGEEMEMEEEDMGMEQLTSYPSGPGFMGFPDDHL